MLDIVLYYAWDLVFVNVMLFFPLGTIEATGQKDIYILVWRLFLMQLDIKLKGEAKILVYLGNGEKYKIVSNLKKWIVWFSNHIDYILKMRYSKNKSVRTQSRIKKCGES